MSLVGYRSQGKQNEGKKQVHSHQYISIIKKRYYTISLNHLRAMHDVFLTYFRPKMTVFWIMRRIV